jgi:hypothetical protein
MNRIQYRPSRVDPVFGIRLHHERFNLRPISTGLQPRKLTRFNTSPSFPQKHPYFHIKTPVLPSCILARQEYLSTQRRRNLPEGESRKGLIERIGNETHAALRQLADVDGTRQALAEE